MEINKLFIFKIVNNHSFNVVAYSMVKNYMDMYGSFDKKKFIDMKKDLYMNITNIVNICPFENGVRIYFTHEIYSN